MADPQHVATQVAIQRRNLLGVCRMCVKSLVDKSSFEVISEECSHLHNLCTVMDNIMRHRLLHSRKSVSYTFFVAEVTVSPWDVVQQFAPPSSVVCVEDMKNISTDFGKIRVWIKTLLVQKRLAEVVAKFVERQAEMDVYYQPDAFLCNEELHILADTLKCLGAIDFSICVKENRDDNRYYEIDYSPYLVFEQSHSSVADDVVEHMKLNGPTAVQPSTRHDGSGTKLQEGEGEGEGEEGVLQVKELLKTEREQRNYFEELVSVRDSQLRHLESQHSAALSKGEEQRRQLETVILELQQQLQVTQEQLMAMKIGPKAPTRSK